MISIYGPFVLIHTRPTSRGKLVVSGGMTRGRVARGIIGQATDDTERHGPKRKRRNNPKREQGRGTASGREAPLHFGGLTSQQTKHGWPRGEKTQDDRARSAKPNSLCAIRAEASAFCDIISKFELCPCESFDNRSIELSSQLHYRRLRCHCLLTIGAEKLSRIEWKRPGPAHLE